MILKFFMFKQRKNKAEISESLEEFEKVCYTLLSSIVSCIPSHGYLIAPFCIDLRTAGFFFFFFLCNCFLVWELLYKTLFKLGHSAEVWAGLIMVILLPWSFMCLLNILKYYFMAEAENLHSKKLPGTWYMWLSCL